MAPNDQNERGIAKLFIKDQICLRTRASATFTGPLIIFESFRRRLTFLFHQHHRHWIWVEWRSINGVLPKTEQLVNNFWILPKKKNKQIPFDLTKVSCNRNYTLIGISQFNEKKKQDHESNRNHVNKSHAMTVKLMAKSKEEKNGFIWFRVCFVTQFHCALSQNRSFQSDYIISIFTRDKSSFITIIFIITATTSTNTNTINSSSTSSTGSSTDKMVLIYCDCWFIIDSAICIKWYAVSICVCICIDWASIVCYLIFNMLKIRSWSRNGHNGNCRNDHLIL